MATKIGTFKKIIIEHLSPNSWVNILDIYALVEKKITHFEPDDFDPLAKYKNKNAGTATVRNVLQELKTNGPIKWDCQEKIHARIELPKQVQTTDEETIKF